MNDEPNFRPDLDKEQTWLRRQARQLLGRRLRGAADSQDISQEAQLAALRNLNGRRFENRIAFRGWLRRILGNRVRDLARSHRSVSAADPSWSKVPDRDQASSAIRSGEVTGDLWRLLRVLPERERTVVRLRIVEELPFAVIAQQLGVSEGHARILFHRSISALRDRAPRGSRE